MNFDESEHKPGSTRKIAAWLLFAAILLSIPIYAATSGLSANGGQVALFSHSADVQVESDTVGDIVTVVGNKNEVRPDQAETKQHQRGEWIFLAVVVVSGIGAIWYWWHRVGGGMSGRPL